VARTKIINAEIICKENAVLCGLDVVKEVFRACDKNIKFSSLVKDGVLVKSNTVVAKIKGRASSVLKAERTALNFLGRLCGISTETKKYANKIKQYKAKIIDTRKTTPVLRILEKYAVSCGGGINHRMGLYDMVLIKDNHKKIIDSNENIIDYILKAKSRYGSSKKIEVEVENLIEFKNVLKAIPDIIMLDNMSLREIKLAVNLNSLESKKTRPKIEASGNISLKNVREIAKTGVDLISVGRIIHSVSSIDFSLEIC